MKKVSQLSVPRSARNINLTACSLPPQPTTVTPCPHLCDLLCFLLVGLSKVLPVRASVLLRSILDAFQSATFLWAFLLQLLLKPFKELVPPPSSIVRGISRFSP
eukprot:c7777_g1_i1 orf=787-1098(+)